MVDNEKDKEIVRHFKTEMQEFIEILNQTNTEDSLKVVFIQATMRKWVGDLNMLVGFDWQTKGIQ